MQRRSLHLLAKLDLKKETISLQNIHEQQNMEMGFNWRNVTRVCLIHKANHSQDWLWVKYGKTSSP